jgi:hypothetical protein
MDDGAGLKSSDENPRVFWAEGYRQQAAGKEQEAEAEQWCEQLIRDVQ